jgi:NAD-dependent SIR2 family protein deacetylase
VVQKAKEIAAVLLSRKERVVCYTGAGISTSADIPGIFLFFIY